MERKRGSQPSGKLTRKKSHLLTPNERAERINEYRIMWLFVFFDLPVKTQQDRKRYAFFRKTLIQGGFAMMQFSVYKRFCMSREQAEAHTQYVKRYLPKNGKISILAVTDRQYGAIENFNGARAKKSEEMPSLFEFI